MAEWGNKLEARQLSACHRQHITVSVTLSAWHCQHDTVSVTLRVLPHPGFQGAGRARSRWNWSCWQSSHYQTGRRRWRSPWSHLLSSLEIMEENKKVGVGNRKSVVLSLESHFYIISSTFTWPNEILVVHLPILIATPRSIDKPVLTQLDKVFPAGVVFALPK